MDITPADLDAEYARALAAWPFLHDVEVSHQLPYQLLLAVGSRETNLTNEIGDGGHGHGVFQLDDRSHPIPAGFDQNVAVQAITAAVMLSSLLAEFNGDIRAALVGYNAGAGVAAYNRAHGLDIDTGTAGGDYSADTSARWQYLRTRFPLPDPTTGQDDDMLVIVTAPNATAQLLVANADVYEFPNEAHRDAWRALGTPIKVIDPAYYATLLSLARPLPS